MSRAVLVAEPEPETRGYLDRQLRDDGFDVLEAARLSQALELAERARPDLVLLAELELCLRLRRGEPGRTWDRNVPVILLAPTSDPVERVRALDRGDELASAARAILVALERTGRLDRRANLLDGEPARHVTTCVAAHSIGHREELEIRVDDVRILIASPRDAAIRLSNCGREDHVVVSRRLVYPDPRLRLVQKDRLRFARRF